jgi:hypothetical protein
VFSPDENPAAGDFVGLARNGEVEDYYLVAGPTGVQMASFSAIQVHDMILVTWETVSELETQGFNLYRGISPAAPDTQLNSQLILSQSPGSPSGFLYTWEDRQDLILGVTYYYWIEAIDFANVATRHGPVSATLSAPTALTLVDFGARPGWPSSLLVAAGLILLAAAVAAGSRRLRMR